MKSSDKEATPYTPINGNPMSTSDDAPFTPFTPVAYHPSNETRAKVVRHEMSEESMRVSELSGGERKGRMEGMQSVSEIPEMDGEDAIVRGLGRER